MLRAFLLVAIVGLIGGQTAQEDAVKKDLKALEGKWTLAALEVNGQDVPIEKLKGTSVLIKEDRYTVTIKDKTFPVVIKLDPRKDPKEIDMIPSEGDKKDQVHKGIYKLQKDGFKIARGLNPEQNRPDQFATWPNTNYFVATWKRAD